MMVTFVSQCEKNALKKTRRVLDAFANRIGDNTWQTLITEDGLLTVKKMLRKTASKSTAVSCHWLRSRARSQLLWVVGNRAKFNAEGVVPVNSTAKEVTQFYDSEAWNMLGVIGYASAIAGLFHDFGKANVLFQAKLKPKNQTNKFEPYRHEWVSLRLFQAFVGNNSDGEWLDLLANNIATSDFDSVFRDGVDGKVSDNHPFLNLPPLAQLVAWLILSHHKLPLIPAWREGVVANAKLVDINHWLADNFEALWNSYNCKDAEQQQFVTKNWNVEHALPVQSMQWRSNASIIASKAKTVLQPYLIESRDWLNHQLFTTHMARLCLMMADHHYSSLEKVTDEWRNPNYEVYANTNRQTNQLKQKLDEHLIGVAHHAQRITNALPKLNRTLSQLADNSFLSTKVAKVHRDNFGWQDEATRLVRQIGKDTQKQGFFGINMASTGKGKTLGNAKIMYALGEEVGRRRFSVALGLRTLTLQTGREFREKLELSDEQLAIAVGGIAVKQLFENAQSELRSEDYQKQSTGSESQDEFLDPDLLVDYSGSLRDHSLNEWTRGNHRLQKLLEAPVLTCTIDHLMPACEGTKGGKQIGPMLRLLTSDLVLDEPDDFGLEDLPALCRLVHWAAMLGSRVLLSTATMPPALTFALFQAYQAGWKEYAKANIQNYDGQIVCAWFDEFSSHGEQFDTFELFKGAHNKFVRGRVKALYEQVNKSKPQRLGDIVTVNCQNDLSIAANLAEIIQASIIKLHQVHQQSHEGKTVSIGLMRMANINPLIAVAKELLKHDAPDDTRIHYCVYHSRYPLAIRSYIEEQLDKILARKDPQAIFKHESINKILSKCPQQNHIFVVLASPVAEVGRDHDYDWGIIEPSSMRSIIQIAGRVLRHRNKTPEQANILLLSKNYKALAGKTLCYERPGFESSDLALDQHDLLSILKPSQYQRINAVERIILPAQYETKDGKYLNLIELEHKALALQLLKGKEPANIWWESTPHWCGEVQRQQRFRNSKKDEAYYLWLTDEFSKTQWKWKNEQVFPPKFGVTPIEIETISDSQIKLGAGIQFWFDLTAQTIYSKLASDFNIDLKKVSMRFGEVRLTEYNGDQQEYCYYPNLGIYQEIGY